jgi:hypothetical protein
MTTEPMAKTALSHFLNQTAIILVSVVFRRMKRSGRVIVKSEGHGASGPRF